jgi:hypothetical protein
MDSTRKSPRPADMAVLHPAIAGVQDAAVLIPKLNQVQVK